MGVGGWESLPSCPLLLDPLLLASSKIVPLPKSSRLFFSKGKCDRITLLENGKIGPSKSSASSGLAAGGRGGGQVGNASLRSCKNRRRKVFFENILRVIIR